MNRKVNVVNSPAESNPTSRPLNVFDQCMLSIDHTLKIMGNPGFETLTLLWFEERIDVPRLKTELQALRDRHPILASRLRVHWWKPRHWNWESDEPIPLHVGSLADSDEGTVFQTAADILSQGRNLQDESSLSFHLLNLPDGSDVLFMKMNHALIDQPSGNLLLWELSQLYGENQLPAPGPIRDRMAEYRQRFSWKERLKAVRRVFPTLVRDRWQPRNYRAKMLPTQQLQKSESPARLKIVSRRLDAETVNRMERYSRQLLRLPSISMTLLGSLFPTFADMVKNPQPNDLFQTGIGVELAPQKPDQFHPQNVSSVLRLGLRREEMAVRSRLVELLNQQLYQQLKSQHDLGLVEANSLFYHSYPMIKRVAGQTIRWVYSYFYAYFAFPEELSHQFGGMALRTACYLGPAWSPPGMTVIATKIREEIHLTLTYVKQLVTDEQAAEFLDGTIADLLQQMSNED